MKVEHIETKIGIFYKYLFKLLLLLYLTFLPLNQLTKS